MINKILIIAILIIAGYSHANAQEVVTPLAKPFYQNPKPIENLKSSFTNFPCIDFFTTNGTPNKQKWEDSSVLIVNRKCVFNAQDINNATYNNPQNIADILTLNPANLKKDADEIFISFRLSAGATFAATDSFLVQLKDNFNNYFTAYSSAGNTPQNTEIILSFKPTRLQQTGFKIKFICYTALNAANTETFILSNFVLSQKNTSPYFNNFSAITPTDSTADGLFFYGADAKVVSGNKIGFIWGNAIALNALDANGNIYGTAGYNGTDTFYTNPYNVENYAANDSIIFSFGVFAGANLNATDSLIVEFRNNLGVWARILGISASAIGSIKQYLYNINWARLRHNNFMARFILLSNVSDTAPYKIMLSSFAINHTKSLPFIDDFSTANFNKANSNWLKNNVYVNNSFPVAQPSVNVATFDGLDANGNAYSRFPLKGIADILTSKPINLSSYSLADSLILSFYYQYEPQGNTNQVYPDDSLIIEFRTTWLGNDSFEIIKMISAADAKLFKFTRIDLPLNKVSYLNSAFQIRIKNKGSLTGNLSHWHIDYVRLNSGRKINDAINDVALTNVPIIYLGNYAAMPWKHYQANKLNYTNDTFSLRLRNHDALNYAVDYFRNIIKPEGDTLDKFNNIQPTLFANSDTVISVNKPVIFNTLATADSFAFDIKYRIRVSGSANDEITTNDSATTRNIFDNYFAYDDGSAEGGYGIKNKLNAGACLKYKVEVPDTLYGLYIYFNQSESDVSTQKFTLKVWKKISPVGKSATEDQVMYSKDYNGPVYTNYLNGFATFLIDPPLSVTDSFFVGWEQQNAFVLNVGLDKNYPFGLNKNHFFKMDGRWYQAEIPGALMIRPVVGKFKTWPTGLNTVLKPISEKLIVYPNPASNSIKFNLTFSNNAVFYICDILGKQVKKGNIETEKIDIADLMPGLYILQITDYLNNYNTKFIIEH